MSDILAVKLGDDSEYTSISFSPPFHGMCSRQQAAMGDLADRGFMFNFQDAGVEMMPDKIHMDGRTFDYSGVSDGIAYYREEKIE